MLSLLLLIFRTIIFIPCIALTSVFLFTGRLSSIAVKWIGVIMFTAMGYDGSAIVKKAIEKINKGE